MNNPEPETVLDPEDTNQVSQRPRSSTSVAVGGSMSEWYYLFLCPSVLLFFCGSVTVSVVCVCECFLACLLCLVPSICFYVCAIW